MVLDNKDIKFCKAFISKISIKALLNNDNDVLYCMELLAEMVDFYESHMNSWEYTSHHDRQAMSFIKRLAITESKDKNNYPEYFEDAFFYLINDYPAIKERYNEWSKGDNV